MAVSATLAARLDAELEADLHRDKRLGKIKRYLEGDHDLPYMPHGAKREYAHLARRAITNWTALLPDTFNKGLFVDGYRPAKAGEDSAAWSYWQDNGLDARQTITHRGVLEYGTAYVLVLPGKDRGRPVIRPLSPLRSLAWYEDEDDEFPKYGLHRVGKTAEGKRIIAVFDDEARYEFRQGDGGEWLPTGTARHGLGVTPFVRFRDRLDGEAVGIIRPVLTMQDRVNEVVFSTLVAMQYASFRQRWATGLAIPVDEEGDAESNPNFGKPVEPFKAAVDRLWVSEDTETKFGDFAQTEISGHIAFYEATVRTLAAIAQVSPNILTGDLVNIGAEALAQMEQSTQRKLSEYETLLGESWESVLRLAAKAAGDTEGAQDRESEVRWRDTEARSLAQTVDALGKMAQMLSVPVEALWERVPGVTEQDVQRWRAMRESDPLAELTAEIARQTARESATNSLVAGPAPTADPAEAEAA